MDRPRLPYYRADLARVHHEGFGFHADACAPGILALLEPVLRRGGTVLEIGCGSGLLTRHLIDAGHRVIASDASPAMLDLARDVVGDALAIRQLTLPGDPLPPADAIVSVGHALSYLPDRSAVHEALVSIAEALRPGGVVAIDVCDLSWGTARTEQPNLSRVTDEWAIITRFSLPAPDRYVREMTTFLRGDDGTWRRDDERHDNVLIDTRELPPLLAAHGLEVRVGRAFGSETLPVGLHTIVGTKEPQR